MEEYLNSGNRDFKRFKLKYKRDEIKCIDSFVISKTKSYSYMGCKKDMITMYSFLSELGDNSTECIEGIEKIVMKLLNNILSVYKKKYYWLSIRATLPNNLYDVPRWHKDGRFFIKSNKASSKFVTVLKGPGTLFIKNTKNVSKIHNDITNKKHYETRQIKDYSIQEQIKIDDKYRPIYVKKLKKAKIIQIKNNEGAIFYTGTVNRIDNKVFITDGALHSEPQMDAPRLFISILPSSKKNIEELKQRWSVK